MVKEGRRGGPQPGAVLEKGKEKKRKGGDYYYLSIVGIKKKRTC